MRETHSLLFAPFRLDLGAERLWCGEEARPLTRKAFAALCYLVAHAGQLVTKEELIEAVWAVPYVSDTALAACIRAIRRALNEQAHVPQFVETVRGRGYRFLAAVTVETLPVASVGADGGGAGGVHPPGLPTPRHNLPVPLTIFIGRETEVAEIRCLLLEEPDCRLLTLVGPGGIGKTRLALRVAETLLATQTEHGTFAQGIFFVPLEAVPGASGIVTAILSVLAEESGFAIQAMDALVLLARTAADEGDYDLAIRLHQQTVAFYRQLNYTAGTARALTNLGNTHILRGDYAAAQPLLEIAHTMAQENNNRFLVMFTGTNLGTVMLELGNYAEAAVYFHKNLLLAREIGDQRWLAVNLNSLSLTALHTHDLDGAQRHAQQALAVAHTIRCEPDVLSSISYLAHVWARQGNVEPALRILLYVDQHPATLARDKNFNATLLTAWREALAPEIITEAAAWGKTKQLDDVVIWIEGGWVHVSEITQRSRIPLPSDNRHNTVSANRATQSGDVAHENLCV